MRLSALASLVVLAACSATPDGDELGHVAQPIVNGVPDSGDPAVVMLLWPEWLCSGTLITPKIVLTAGHCADDDKGTPPSYVYFGPGPFSKTTSVTATLTIRHPSYDNQLNGGGTILNDVALVILDQPVTNVAPLPPNFTTLTDLMILGRDIKYVGFGKQSGADNAPLGTKQTITVTGRVLTDQNVDGDQATCQGDSGGPALKTINGRNVVVAVTSWGPAGCGSASVSQRVDIHKDWMNGLIQQYDPPSCGSDGRCATGCSTPDPDCLCQADGICSPGCPAPDPDCGDPCGAEGHCIQECATRDPDCPAPKAPGATCLDEFECGDGNACVSVEAGQPAECAAKCGTGFSACGDGMSCDALAGSKPPVSVCRLMPAAGGCSIAAGHAGAGAPAGSLLALLGAAFVLRRKHAGSRHRQRRSHADR